MNDWSITSFKQLWVPERHGSGQAENFQPLMPLISTPASTVRFWRHGRLNRKKGGLKNQMV